MGPSPDLWFLRAKQRLFDQNYKSLETSNSDAKVAVVKAQNHR